MKRYEKYKDSGIEWIGEIPIHWEVKKLKYIANANPSNIDKKSKEDEQDIFLCNYTDVYYNDFISSKIDFMKATASKSQIDKFLLKKGDVIVTKDSETADDIGIPALVFEDFDNVVCGYHLTQIKPISILGEYLFRNFQCKFLKSYFEVSSNGITRYGLGVDELNSSPIIIPPLEEQMAIANYLDQKTAEIDELIKQKVALLLLFEEEKTAIINHAVTKGIDHNVKLKDSKIEWLGKIPEHWEVKKLKYVANIVLGKMLTSEDKGEYFLKPYLRAANLNWLSANVDDVKEMWFSEKELVKYRIDNNDLLVSEGGEVGRTCIWKSEINECYIQNSVHKVTINKNNDPAFFLYQFYSFGEKGSFDAIVNRISIAHLTVEKLKEILFLVPTKEEQEQIVKFINSESKRIEKKVDLALNLIELLKQYKTALISEVATGKVKVI